MSALPRPDLAAGPHHDLNDALHDLHHRAGWPSLRTLARMTGVSHTTVSKAFSTATLPTWGTLELVVEALDGDTEAFHDLWLAASTGRVEDVAAPAPRIAGRRAELDVVRRHLDTGTGLFLVVGEAGIGKTTLVRAAAERCDAFVAVGHCLPLSAEVPLMPVVDLLRGIHAHGDGHWFKDALADCPAYVGGLMTRLLPELDAGDDPHGSDFARPHLFAAVASVLDALATYDRVALVIEDAHWADTATMALVEYVVSRGCRAPVVATWRNDDPAVTAVHHEWLARLRRLSEVQSVVLGPLLPDETAEQLRLAGITNARAAREIHERSRGNPLYTALIAVHDGPRSSSLPPELAGLLDQRLDHLSRPAGQLASAMAVAARPVPVEVMAEVTALARDEVQLALGELSTQHLLARDSGDLAQLAHPLLVEAAQRRLLPGEGGRLHRLLAESLAARPGHVDPGEVAEHWRSAGDPVQEARWRMAAAEQAQQRTQPRSASAHWCRVLEICRGHDVPDVDPVSAWTGAFDAFQLSGELEQARALCSEQLPDVDRLPPQQAAEVLRRAALIAQVVLDDMQGSLTLLDQALTRLGGQPVSPCLVRILVQRANSLIDLGRFEEAVHDLSRGLEACELLGDAALFFHTSATLGWHRGHQGDLPGALDCFRAARLRMPEPTDPWLEAYLAMMETDVLLRHHRPPEEVERAAERALRIAGRWEMSFHLLTVVRANVVESYLDAGRVEEAVTRLADVPSSDSYDDWPGAWMTARVALVQGRLDDAGAVIHRLLRAGSSPPTMLRRAVWEAATLLWSGRPADAWAALHDPLEVMLDNRGVADYWLGFLYLARAAADRVALGDAATTAELVELRRRAMVDPLDPGRAPPVRVAAGLTWDAELHRIAGTDDAKEWGWAASAWDLHGRPHQAAYCRWRAAQCAIRDGERTLAARQLSRAAIEAREHVPLSEAIAATRAGVR
ncbi:ATP-binding protein [Nocardia sp. N13]|uniref:ATP-binding protein n=1 Tax=Nocardioides sp. N13(2025) TaxID=3453405 RepID=UPI003F7750E6